MNYQMQIEALLFAKGDAVPFKTIASLLDISEEETRTQVHALQETLSGRGICLITTKTHVELRTAPETSEIIQKLYADEFAISIGRASLETLAIILYKGPIGKSKIEYIRGVNAAAALRNLLMRGLIERTTNPKDARSYLYRTTPKLLAHLGVEDVTQLPSYDTFVRELTALEETLSENTHHG